MNAWPALSYHEWFKTYETLHRWLQIVGKFRLGHSPLVNHSWQATFSITARGFTTTPIPLPGRLVTVDFDLIDHRLIFADSLGHGYELELLNESVASFYSRFRRALSELDLTFEADPRPNECEDFLPFADDIIHETYVTVHATRAFEAFARAYAILSCFRSRFVGKCSPVHLFWGSFDLAVTRFSGRLAPEHPGQAPHVSALVMKEAYSHEVSSCGFWPGNAAYPQAAFYSYAYPAPKGFDTAVELHGVEYLRDLGEYVLPYDEVLKTPDPEQTVMEFLQTTYEAAADLGNWDRERLEESPFLQLLTAKRNRPSIDPKNFKLVS